MRNSILILILVFANLSLGYSQDTTLAKKDKKHNIVWSAGVFKSWLTDKTVGFNKIGDKVTPVFDEQKKIGLSFQSHYLYNPVKFFGFGVHLGLGLDVYSNIKAPVVLFGASVSFGNDHQFIIDFGWADGKRKIVPGALEYELKNEVYTEIPEIHEYSQLNTGFYVGFGYKIF